MICCGVLSVLLSSAGYAKARIAVLVAPGFMQFERTWVLLSNSSANICINPSVANLDTEYAPQYALPF